MTTPDRTAPLTAEEAYAYYLDEISRRYVRDETLREAAESYEASARTWNRHAAESSGQASLIAETRAQTWAAAAVDVRARIATARAGEGLDGLRLPTKLLRCEWPPNPGVEPGDERFDAILASVREDGIREPLTIKLDWSVIDGAHRLSAARLLGIELVPVRIWTGTEMVPALRTASPHQRGGVMNEQPVTETLSAEEWTAERLRAWAGCVRRLMAVAPTRAVKAETGVTGGHSTPPERAAIREAALRVVDQWLERDVLDAARAGEGLEDTRLLARCLGNFTIGQFDDLPPEARAAWIENAVDVQRAVRQYRAASPTSEEK